MSRRSPHLHGRAVTHHGYTISIHTKEIAGHKIIVAANEEKCVRSIASVAREAESLYRGTGTIASRSASRGRTSRITASLVGSPMILIRMWALSPIVDRVCACARLRVAIDDHRLSEPRTEVHLSAKTLSERDGANVRGGIAARIA